MNQKNVKNSILECYPILCKEWDYEKNGDLTPSNISYGSTKKIWWKCNKNHSWDATPNQRTSRNQGCPFCSHRRLLKGFNDFETTKPELAKEWHPTKNGNLKPCDVMEGSKKKVWWKCQICDYEWTASLKSRKKGSGCKYCSARTKDLIPGRNDLFTVSPELAKEWHPIKNGKLTPHDISSKSNIKVWWLGKCNHEWETTPAERLRGRNCPICSGRKVLKGYNDLATTNPELAKMWHPTKNNELTPYDVSRGSHEKVWWIAPCGHEWESPINSMLKNKTGCPICAREISTSFPEQAILYEIGKIKKTVSRCKINGDEIDIYLPEINCGIEYNGLYWHKNKTSLDNLKYERLRKSVDKLVVVKEVKKGDVIIENNSIVYPIDSEYSLLDEVIKIIIKKFSLDIKNIIIDTKKDKINIYEQYIKTIKSNSVLSVYPQLAKEWNYERNGNLNPAFIQFGSTKKVWWKCNENHEWDASPNQRTSKNNGCPFCSHRRLLKGYNDLATTNPELAKEWHPTKNGDLKPCDVMQGSHKKVWWQCPKCGRERYNSPHNIRKCLCRNKI